MRTRHITRCIRLLVFMVCSTYTTRYALATDNELMRPAPISPYVEDVGAPNVPPQPECDPDRPTWCSAPIQAGQPSPFDGQVLTVPLAIDIGQKANDCAARTAIEVSRAQRQGEVEVAHARQIEAIEVKACEAEKEVIKRNCDPDVPIWEHPLVVGTFASAATAVLMVAVWYVAVRTVEAVGE